MPSITITSKKGGQRFGQIIWNAMAEGGYWESPEANDLFFIENEEFKKILKKERKFCNK